MGKQQLFLIDGTGLVYKAFFAIQNLSTSKGQPVNALYGLARMLIKLLRERVQPGDYCCFAVDTSRQTFRQEILKEYKATRQQTPEELAEQIPLAKKLASAFGLFVWGAEGFEADDLIATLACRYASEMSKTWIITSDKDLMQLVSDQVNLLRAEKGVSELKAYAPQQVREKYQIDVTQFVDYLALIGDTSDNIPGVRGIGPKSAVSLLKSFASIEAIFSNLDRVSPSLRKKLEGQQEIAMISKRLVQLDHHVEQDLSLADLAFKGSSDQLVELLSQLEFRSMIQEIAKTGQQDLFPTDTITLGVSQEQEKGQDPQPHPEEVKVVTQASLTEVLDLLAASSELGFDIETDSLDFLTASLVGCSVYLPSGEAFYFPFKHAGFNDNLPHSAIQDMLDAIQNDHTRVVGHNLKFDLSVLQQLGYRIESDFYDSMIASYLLDPDRRNFGLKALAKEHLGMDMITFEEAVGKTTNRQEPRTFAHVPVTKAAEYACSDAYATYQLYTLTKDALESEDLSPLFKYVEMPLVKVLMEMEKNGVFFDMDYLKGLSESFGSEAQELQSQIFDACGESFNLNSPKQLGKILFEKLKLPSKGRTSKSKDYSTSAAVLETLAQEYDVARLLMEYRKVTKLKSTYVDAIPLLMHPVTKRVHSSFHQTGTSTGRLSSSDPNLQNLPVKDEKGRMIRQAVVPQRKGWKLISADYSQIELRLMAHIADDKQLIQAFKEEKDIHTVTSSAIFGVKEEEVTSEMRRVGKMVNFSIIYGVSAYGLASRLGLSNAEGTRIIEQYFYAYPGVKTYMTEIVKKAKADKEVRTLLGRKRKVPWIDAHNSRLRSEAQRIAINAPIQGTAADVMKLAMIHVDNRMKRDHIEGQMILQVHDELVIEAPENQADTVARILNEEMEEVMQLQVPLKVDIAITDHFE